MAGTRSRSSPGRRSTGRRTEPVAGQLVELGIAVPQVIASRIGRMALAGPVLSARDRREFSGMVLEKQVAFAQSWMAMCTEAMLAQQQWMLAWLSGTPGAGALHAAMDRIAARGVAPVRRKAVANARRLRRTR